MAAVELSQEWRGVRMIDASKARQSFRDVLDLAATQGGRLVIQRNGRPVAALVSMGELSDLLDRDAVADQAMIAADPHAADADRALDTPVDELWTATVLPAAVEGGPGGRFNSPGLLAGLEAEVASLIRTRVEHLAERIARQTSEMTIDEVQSRDRGEAVSDLEETEKTKVIEHVTTNVVEKLRNSESPEIESFFGATSELAEVRETVQES